MCIIHLMLHLLYFNYNMLKLPKICYLLKLD
nr:MAG TPA: hypothetical protein [Caudoviricetes sp.]